MEHIYKTLKPGNKEYKVLCEKFLTQIRPGYVEIDKGVCVLPVEYLKFALEYEDFEVRDSDVFVISYPKAGTTWTQEMVWLIANNLDFEGAKNYLNSRFPFFEYSSFRNNFVKKNQPEYVEPTEFLNKISGRRFVKTHLPWSLLPTQILNSAKQPKIIYVMRNPKDACVSGHYYYGSLGYTGSFEELADIYLSGQIDYGSFWNHVLGYWEQRHRKNLLIITYEDMQMDLRKVIGKVANFLEKSLTDQQISLLVDHLNFDSMRKNNAVNPDAKMKEFHRKFRNAELTTSFMRSGKMGDYCSLMSAEIAAKFDEMTKEKFRNIDFPYLDTMLL